MVNKNYEFLQPYIDKIVVLKGTETKDKKVFMPRWKENRKDFLYNGKITNQNLRQILSIEIPIEFDKKVKAEFKDLRKEALKWVNEIRNYLTERNLTHYITDHQGISPHVRLFIQGLDIYDWDIIKQYKIKFSEFLLKEIGFKSHLVQLDYSLIETELKLISLEEVPHWKQKYNGNIEKIIYQHKGIDIKVNPDKIYEIKRNLKSKQSCEIVYEKVNLKEVDIKALKYFFREYYTDGQRNNAVMAISAHLYQVGLTPEQIKNLLKIGLNEVKQGFRYQECLNRVNSMFKKDPKHVSSTFFSKHLKEKGDSNE